MTITSSYDPCDNKLRLRATSRLDPELYARVRGAGFIWAPKQELFVAPMWTPDREDLLLELCGEIGDEDTSLVERAEQRAERFEDYSDNRQKDADRAHAAVHAIADNIPFGQPILIGHHSERHARKDAEKIQNNMRKAVSMWEQSKYWIDRAKGAIRHAKYKERPDVRARRIKGIEADQRKAQKNRDKSAHLITLWENIHDDNNTKLKRKDGQPNTFLERARYLANYDAVGIVPYDCAGYPSYWSAWDVLRPDGERYSNCPAVPPEEVQAKALAHHRAYIAHNDRWLTHYANRLEYERAMLSESGGTVTDRTGPEVGGACKCWSSPGHGSGWSYIVKVNKVSVSIMDKPPYGERTYRRTMPFDQLRQVMTKAQVDEKRATGCLMETEYKEGFFLSDSPPEPRPIRNTETTPEDKVFEDLKDKLKDGVKVVTAPQLFPTPPDLAAQLVSLATIQRGQTVLEPSAGTGNIIDAIRRELDQDGCFITAVELNYNLASMLKGSGYTRANVVHQTDFLECNGDLGLFDRILMNPPFANGQDIKHITHALGFLKPNGKLVAICANGPRQQEALKPIADYWEDLPEGTFKESGTNVNTALLVIEKPE